jgi:hypothetical protein
VSQSLQQRTADSSVRETSCNTINLLSSSNTEAVAANSLSLAATPQPRRNTLDVVYSPRA